VKNLWVGLAGLAFGMAGTLAAQQLAGEPDAKTLFPSHWVRGYVGFDVAPPHNEPDLGRCFASTGEYGANAPCAAYARYMTGGYVEIQPFGRTVLRHVFLFVKPLMSMGNNVPKVSYTWSGNPIALDNSFGLGVELPKNFEFRATLHSIYWLGRYQNWLGYADFGPSGLYGDYATLGGRWYFGGYGHSREPQ